MSFWASGAKGITNFSESIKYGYLPKESSIEHEGIFYDYFFETKDESKKLFAANYSLAVTKDPLNGELEYYLGIGMASCLDGEGFYKHGGRPSLNIVIILDISGSMGSSFSGTGESKSKIEVAKESILALLSHLKEQDRFGLVLFDDQAIVVQELMTWASTNQTELKEKIVQIKVRGGTCLSEGIKAGTALFKSVEKAQTNENRMIFLTDMIPNTGDTDGKALFNITKNNAQEKIYTTFIGVGVDFNTDLVALISKIRACNYISVKSSKDFKKEMDEEFDYFVTPIVFECSVNIANSDNGWQVERVYGSPGFEIPEQGRLMFLDSSFPSRKEGSNMTKGGIVVVKLKKPGNTPPKMKLVIKYEGRDGQKYEDVDEFDPGDFATSPVDKFQDSSVRKAVLLVRYVNFMKHLLNDARSNESQDIAIVSMDSKTGILPPQVKNTINHNSSLRLRPLNKDSKVLIKQFVDYFEREMEAIDDKTLDKEMQQLVTILQTGENKHLT